MRETLIEKVLKVILAGAGTTADVIGAILESGYGASYSKLSRSFDRRQNRKIHAELAGVERQRFYSLLSKLKREGFILEKAERWNLTVNGKMKLVKLKKTRKGSLPSAEYSKSESREGIIITFDIPEKDRHKRRWLRSALGNLGFKLYQKSVWVGRGKVPEEFLMDLKRIGIFRYVGILSVGKSGTIEEYVKNG